MDDEDLAIGIDLGTTYSCVAVMRNERVEIIPNEIGENLTPSVVSFTENGILVGEQTLNQLIINPKKTIYSIKRLMGKNYNDKEVLNDIKSNFWAFDVVEQKSSKRPVIKIENENKKKTDFYFPEQISKFILEKLIKSARSHLNNKFIKKAVITIPAYFDDAQRQATELAAVQAGLEVLRIINEPTAAALAYGLDKKFSKQNDLNQSYFSMNIEDFNKTPKNEEDEKLIIVFDLGGGTFDVSLLKIDEGEIFSVLAKSGNSHLGGDDFDKKIIEHCLKEFCSKLNIDKRKVEEDKKAMNRLKIASERAKIQLSSENEAIIDIDEFYNNQLLHIRLTREIFEELCKDLFYKLIKPLDEVLDSSKKSITEINEIVFVGGSTRIPKIKRIIQDYFFDVHINNSINPDETVAYGAAIQAAKLMRQGRDILDDVILMDITPFSLGINVLNESKDEEIYNKGDIMSVIIPRHSKIPIEKTDNFQTVKDFQKAIRIKVFEGENKYIKYNHFLGSFKMENIPLKKEGEVKVAVNFKIDENGILTVTAVEKSKGITNYLKVINDKGFNKDEIIENINNTFLSLVNDDNKEFKNYKKEMNEYYKYYTETYSNKEKSKYLYNFCETLINFINTFDKKGNDTLGNKYFLYIKVLFQGFKELIILNEITIEEKNFIIINSKNFLKILSTFQNTNYKTYVDLLNNLEIPLISEEIKKYSAEQEKQINEERNNILFDFVIYVMELIETKAEQYLSSEKKFSRYNSKYLFQNCILISDLFIKSDRDLSKNVDLKKRYTKCYEKCISEIKKINANSLIEIDVIKKSGKLIDKAEKMEREQLLILLDNYREALHNIQGMNDYELEAIILANIVKINYIYLKSENYTLLRTMSEQSVALAKQTNTNVEKFKWYLEISKILQDLRKVFEDKERYEQQDFENKYKNEKKNIFDEIKEYRGKTNIEFIEFVLEKYPPKKSPLKPNQTIRNLWEKDAKSFVEKLSARYNPDNYPKNTEEEKLKYTIYRTISTEINSILSELNPNTTTCE